MLSINWSVNLDGQEQLIHLDHGMVMGKRIIKVNDKIVHQSSKLIDFGKSEHPFQIGTHTCNVIINARSGITYELYIDDKLYQTQNISSLQVLKAVPIQFWITWIVIVTVVVFIVLNLLAQACTC